MGQISSNDVVILISNSGQSNELNNIIQYVTRNKNIKLIGITSKKDSLLYKYSNVKFLIPKIKEAGLENIVPTSSTTAQLALGDAISIACMNNKNFTKFDFKKFIQLIVIFKVKTVGDLMSTGEKFKCKWKCEYGKSYKEINDKKLGVLLIKKIVIPAILTDGDLKRIAQKYKKFENLDLKNNEKTIKHW